MIDITGVTVSTILGTISGIVIGLLPGMGVSTATLLLAPLLVQFNPMYGLIFFVALLVTSQYTGTITSLIYGVPGELSSYPVINERKHLLDKTTDVLQQSALGSLIGATVAMIAFVALMYLADLWINLYNYKVFGWVILLTVISVIMFGSQTNKALTNMVLFISGYFLSKIGYNQNSMVEWGTFGFTSLLNGVPLMALAFGLVVIPNLINGTRHSVISQAVDDLTQSYTRLAAIIRGCILGIIGGLVPGVTYMVSTQMSYVTEQRLSKTDAVSRVVGPSTADNAGAVSSLYTLFWLGIPITLGEAVVVWLFDKNNQPLTWGLLNQHMQLPLGKLTYFEIIMSAFFVANMTAYLLSGPGRTMAKKLARHLLTPQASYVIFTLTVCSLYFAAAESRSQLIFLITLIISSVVSLVLRRIDWMPVIIGFILQDIIEGILYKLNILTF